MSDEQSTYKKAYERERKARHSAELLLEEKTLEIYTTLGTLREQYAVMAGQQKRLEMAASLAQFAQTESGFRENIEFLLKKGCEVCGASFGGLFLFNSEHGIPVYFSAIQDPENKNILNAANRVREQIHCQPDSLLSVFRNGLPAQQPCSEAEAGEPDRVVLFPVPPFGSVACVLIFGLRTADVDADHFITLVSGSVSQLGLILQRSEAERSIQENYAQLQAAYSEVKEVQMQLSQSEKMASLGQLAAGVAHEINNPVGFVLSNIGTLADYALVFIRALKLYQKAGSEIEQGQVDAAAGVLEKIGELAEKEDLPFILDDVKDVIAESERGLQRVREIVSGLKSFARVDEAQFKHADINECLDSTLKMASSEIRYKCEVETEFGELPEIMCNPGQLNQVFLNLIMNAGQAIETKGVIKVHTRVEGDHILVLIADNGSGIDEENIAKLFTPFFTTKDVGVGTGLGLSISYGIIKKHGGEIKVSSELGKGTTFEITLPLSGVPEEMLREALEPSRR